MNFDKLDYRKSKPIEARKLAIDIRIRLKKDISIGYLFRLTTTLLVIEQLQKEYPEK